MIIATISQPAATMVDIDAIYRVYGESKWLDDPIVKQIIKDIDKSDVISPYCIYSPVLGQITMDRVSGSAKALILMLKMPKMQIWAQLCGDNCCTWIIKISKIHDIHLVFSNSMGFDKAAEFDMYITNDGNLIHDWKSFIDELVLHIDEMYGDREPDYVPYVK